MAEESNPTLTLAQHLGAGHDGFLYAEEIYNLHLQARLVVLSGCESGVGKAYQGEGLMALTRGFFYAGAQQVMCSLWKVLDESARGYMVHFYRSTVHGHTFASAMRQTKLILISSPSTSFPREWAGFILMGM